jgi:hypothetical protein
MQLAFTDELCMTVRVFDMATDAEIGVLTDEQFQFLQDHLEAEDADDDDYYINRATLDAFDEQGGDRAVVGWLRTAMGSRDEMDIRWQRDEVAEAAEVDTPTG